MSINKYRSITKVLSQPTILLERQLELHNLIFGIEQLNRYKILSPSTNETVGYAVERPKSLTGFILRQVTKLHRPFVVDIFDNLDNHLFTVSRKFSAINSHIKVWNDDFLIGESVQRWHMWRRKYDLFVNRGKAMQNVTLSQFGSIDSPFLAFEFPVYDEVGKINGCVDRNWVGLGREFFTDTGVYVLRFDSRKSFEGVYDMRNLSSTILNLNERAVLLGNAISIDFDYFSRHSRHFGSGFISFTNDEF
ncbi:hypothetical protein KAFR_0G00880 [Kazachstania africana CBS 2517]|uniref:Phospholipid scramblase n=1 Tax=Kazachstania africana (strain ATCC 22294 / BCRC 22015 / CBS 2517 / CECT 1963 / NBRC 1671 / NRRL Y-8276) TaxID=1071382 RepID=H2AXM1_KAZAF|nr:hypothetical protein KAFR_0G00880 [Kazachstania africana CBS 2517]CCF59121.1 hypothetical protein KAFR_0G00880 [Kazachstania africana CBS 2517]